MADSYTAKMNIRTTVNGKSVSSNYTATGQNHRGTKKRLTKAFAGVLGTRTDNDTGIVTGIATGHGITTGDFVCVAWLVSGVWTYRYEVDITSVTATTISIDIGSGTNLPIATTAVVVSVRQRENIVITGFNSLSSLSEQYKSILLASTKDALAVWTITDESDDLFGPVIVTPTVPVAWISGVTGLQPDPFFNNVFLGGTGVLVASKWLDWYNLDTETAGNAVESSFISDF